MFICNSSSLAIRDSPFYICVEPWKQRRRRRRRRRRKSESQNRLSKRGKRRAFTQSVLVSTSPDLQQASPLLAFSSSLAWSLSVLALKPSVRLLVSLKDLASPEDSNLAPQRSRFCCSSNFCASSWPQTTTRFTPFQSISSLRSHTLAKMLSIQLDGINFFPSPFSL